MYLQQKTRGRENAYDRLQQKYDLIYFLRCALTEFKWRQPSNLCQ